MNHPSEEQLALYFGGDLGWWEHARITGHLRYCPSCQAEHEAYRQSNVHLSSVLNQLPANLNWNRLSAEMTANINLGFQAGEIVGATRVPRKPRIEWRPIAALTVAVASIITAWWLNPPTRIQPGAGSHGVELRTTAAGIELTDNGNALTLRHASQRQRPVILSAPGSLRARYIDDFGQVTINNVYSE